MIKKYLIAILFIISILSISCQLTTTRPKRNNSSSSQTNETNNDNNTEESGKLDFPYDKLIIDLKGNGQEVDTLTQDIDNNSQDSSFSILFKNQCPEKILTNVTYELKANFAQNEESADEYFEISPRVDTHNDKAGPKLSIKILELKNILQEGRTKFDFELTIKSDNYKKGTLNFYIILNKKN